jgi:hypothetical protein
MSKRPTFLNTRKKYTKRGLPRAMRRMLKQRPRLAVATFQDDERKNGRGKRGIAHAQ